MKLDLGLPEHARSTIVRFVRAHTIEDGAAGALVGLSGGIDSAVVAALAVEAVGADRVVGAFLPDAGYPEDLTVDVGRFAADAGLELRTLALDTAEAAVRTLVPEVHDPATWGNVKARLRMLLLYTLARERRLRVLGTGNKSELLMGYFTKYGDGGVDLLPIGDLYKTQVRALALELRIPDSIRARPPSAGLWAGQTDEDELGISYDRLDPILLGIERLADPETIAAATGETPEQVRAIEARILAFRHKRRLPPVAKVGLRTVGLDWKD